jgi:hypothetical protein
MKWAFVLIAMLPVSLYNRTVLSADGAALSYALVITALCFSAARRQFCGVAPSSWRLHRPHSQGREACRPAGTAGHKSRAVHQPQDRQGTRHYVSAHACRARWIAVVSSSSAWGTLGEGERGAEAWPPCALCFLEASSRRQKMARGPAFALIVVELGLSDTRCNPIYRRDDFMPDLGESGMRKSLARTRTDAGNCIKQWTLTPAIKIPCYSKKIP